MIQKNKYLSSLFRLIPNVIPVYVARNSNKFSIKKNY